ncbi:MAG TPA: hypothetical protein V6D11_03250 [Waterburya sp.]
MEAISLRHYINSWQGAKESVLIQSFSEDDRSDGVDLECEQSA